MTVFKKRSPLTRLMTRPQTCHSKERSQAMPSGNRHRLTIVGRKIDISPVQFLILQTSKQISPARKDHNFLQRVEGLRKQGLLTKREGKFVRTTLGLEVLARIRAKAKKANGK